MERLLHEAGHRLVQRVTIVDAEAQRHAFDWPAVADGARWQEDGQLLIGDAVFSAQNVASVEVEAPASAAEVEAGIVDVAPTVAAALGLAPPERATGRDLDAPAAQRALIVLLDGFGHLAYQDAAGRGLTLLARTVYPPITTVASGALFTGAEPARSGVDQRGIRKTDAQTLFDVAAAAGLKVVAVEGEALPFDVGSARLVLSGDRDGNGQTDDNVLANALAEIEAGMPDLLYVHFHGTDDTGHEFGPRTPEVDAAIARCDDGVRQIVEAAPPGTLVVVLADHGMHAVEEGGRLGNHGHLIEEDMLIPLFLFERR
jgi:hypothetical protein